MSQGCLTEFGERPLATPRITLYGLQRSRLCAAVAGVPGASPRRQPGQGRPARSTTSGSYGHSVIGLEDKASCSVLTMVSLIVLAHDGKRVENVFGLDSSETVDVKHRGIQVSPQK